MIVYTHTHLLWQSCLLSLRLLDNQSSSPDNTNINDNGIPGTQQTTSVPSLREDIIQIFTTIILAGLDRDKNGYKILEDTLYTIYNSCLNGGVDSNFPRDVVSKIGERIVRKVYQTQSLSTVLLVS